MEQTTLTVQNIDIPKETLTLTIAEPTKFVLSCDTNLIVSENIVEIYSLETVKAYKEYFTCVAYSETEGDREELYFILPENSKLNKDEFIPETINKSDITSLEEFIPLFVSGNLTHAEIKNCLDVLNIEARYTYETEGIISSAEVIYEPIEVEQSGAFSTKDDKFISSMDYVPDFQQDTDLFKDATLLLDRLLTDTEDETLREINQAYCDTLYKYSAYSKLSYGAKITLLQELGFDYILDLLLHMYDLEYEELQRQYSIGDIDTIPLYDDFVQEKADSALTKLTTFFNIVNILKGKTLGLELVLGILGIPSYIYMPWNIIADPQGKWEGTVETLPLPGGYYDVKPGWGYVVNVDGTEAFYIFNGVAWHACDNFSLYESPREPLTAVLDIYGAFSTDLQKKLHTFVRSYMLPKIDVTLKFTANMPQVYAFPSGVFDLYHLFRLEDYYNNGEHIQHELIHQLSNEHWQYSDRFSKREITVGNGEIPFAGSVDLTRSWVKDDKGNKQCLYGTDLIVAEAISGTALEKLDSKGNIMDFQGTTVDVPLDNYIELDITTGEQQNPYWEDNVFHRDTFIKFYQQIIIKAIHLAKTVSEMEEIRVGDFEKEFDTEEVYLGRTTEVEAQSGKDYVLTVETRLNNLKDKYNDELLGKGVPQDVIDDYVYTCKKYYTGNTYFIKNHAEQHKNELEQIYPHLTILTKFAFFYEFTYTDADVRDTNGTETHRLVFCEDKINENKYTGIGDLGILGANDYFIYNGRLMYHTENSFAQIGQDNSWADVGASHAVSDMYYTPAINAGKLCAVHKDSITEIARDVNNLDAYEIYITKNTPEDLEEDHEENIENEETERVYTESWYILDDFWNETESNKWTAITGYINDFYTAFGICDGRLYKLYKNPYFGDVKEDGSKEPMLVYQILDNEQGWQYITGVDYSETYEAYGIKNGRLYRVTSEGFKEVTRTNTVVRNSLSDLDYTQEKTEEYDTYTFKYKNELDKLEKIEIIFKEAYEDMIISEGTITTTYHPKAVETIKFNGDVQEFTVDEYGLITTRNLVVNTGYKDIFIEYVKVGTDTYTSDIIFGEKGLKTFEFIEKNEISGWDSSFDCISRYHHCNDGYATYGIANNKLYYINNETVALLDDTKSWTAVCGYYNDASPRTFAYAIADGILYELKNKEIIEKDADMFWCEVHGCTTATNNYVIGLAKNSKTDASCFIYKINAKTLVKIDEEAGWTSCFGRTTASTSASNNCYGYGIKNNKLQQINKDGSISTISGFWQEEGASTIADLADYNIQTIKANLSDGSVVEGEQAIKDTAVADGMTLSDYDIFVSYKTKGFANNERYIVRTELTDTNYTYINPEECRTDVSEAHCEGLFDKYTGDMSDFVQYNVETHNANTIDGDGVASCFAEKQAYLTIPRYAQANNISMNITVSFTISDDKLHPIILGNVENGEIATASTGIYYGHAEGKYGLFCKAFNGTDLITRHILDCEKNPDIEETCELKFTIQNIGKTFNVVNISLIKDTPISVYNSSSSEYVTIPYYIGGSLIINEYSDIKVPLNKSYITSTEGTMYLLENGKYFSLDTQKQDLNEKIHTYDNQSTQKIIEVTKADGTKLEFTMDELYTQMVPKCTKGDLAVSTDYNVNRLRSDLYEGTTTATLNYVGEYKLDEEKISPNMSLSNVYGCTFAQTGVASHLNEAQKVQFKLSTDITSPIYIKSGSVVEDQGLFKTEENEAYTNKYLLQSVVTVNSKLDCRAVPSGIIYELNSDAPKTVTKTLTYNNDGFEINPEIISNYEEYYFNRYDAELFIYPEVEYDEEESTTAYKERFVTIDITAEDYHINEKNVVGKFDLKLCNNNLNEEFLHYDDQILNTLDTGDVWYHFDITKHYEDINSDWLVSEETKAEEPKDKLQTEDGQVWNYSQDAYQRFKNVNNLSEGFVLCLLTDDDTSKDQGIFGFPGKAGFGIKDNMWTYTDDKGNSTKSTVIVRDNAVKYIKFQRNKDKFDIYISDDNTAWELLFANMPIYSEGILGYCVINHENLAYNGTIDLGRSYILDDNSRLYVLEQNTNILVSKDGTNYEELQTIVTPYAITELTLGYHYSGTLDCFTSKLLKSYDLTWVENYQKIDEVVKNALEQADPTYNKELDENIYDLTEYGIYLEDTPKRWDTIKVTYKTVDKAFYMSPNTEYTIQMDVVDDKESGKSLVEVEGSPSWDNGIVSDFENGYLTTTLSSGSYYVFKFNLNGNDQALCGYVGRNELTEEYDTAARCVYTEDNKVKYWDDLEEHELFEITQDTCWIKLYTLDNQDHEIEYSLDGVNFQSTGIQAVFTGYDTFALGNGFVHEELKPFKGSIDLTESYQVSGNISTEKAYLFKFYKKVYPYIIQSGKKYDLSLKPLLTLNDYVTFAYRFDGELYMEKSGLVLPDTRGWQANQIRVYEELDGEKHLLDTVIRDSIEIDPKYIIEEELVEIDPSDLQVYIQGDPKIGEQIVLTYDTWYLFRQKDSDYEFKITYTDDDKAYISFKQEDTEENEYPEYIIYYTERQNLHVNTGYQLNGVLKIKDSTRGGMKLCNHTVWYSYAIKYRKYEDSDWEIWTEFMSDNITGIKQTSGYALKGTHNLASSWFKTSFVETPFVSFYNQEYIKPVGNISFSANGVATGFTKEDYLAVVMDKMKDGYTVSFFISSEDAHNQTISTWLSSLDGYFKTKEPSEIDEFPFKPNYNYIVQYMFGSYGITVGDVNSMTVEQLGNTLIKMFTTSDGEIAIRILGYNVGKIEYCPAKEKPHNVTIIPYNPKKTEGTTGYYVTSKEQANKISVSYRKVENTYDHHTRQGEDVWYTVELTKQQVSYFNKPLEVYAATVPFGFAVSADKTTNYNPDGVEYNRGDLIEFKVSSQENVYTTVMPYNDLIKRIRAEF